MASIFKRGSTFHVKYRDPQTGKWVYKSLKTQNKKEATEAKRKIDAALTGLPTAPQRPTTSMLTLAELESKYLQWASAHLSPGTIQLRERALKRLQEWFPHLTRMEEVTQDVVEEYKARLGARQTNTGRHVGPRTVNEGVQSLKAVWGRARRQGWHTGPNPWATTAALSENRRLPRWLTPAQRAELLTQAELLGWHVHLGIGLMLYAGLRRRELAFARRDWLDLEANILSIRADPGSAPGRHRFDLKDREERAVPISAPLRAIIARYWEQIMADPHGYLMPARRATGRAKYRYDIRRPVAKAAKAAGITGCTPHVLRHTFASAYAQAGVSLYKIARWMGHASSTVTERYAHLTPHDTDIERIESTTAAPPP